MSLYPWVEEDDLQGSFTSFEDKHKDNISVITQVESRFIQLKDIDGVFK